jgi:pimeloyl-ACP methyl ester carboxylesterase
MSPKLDKHFFWTRLGLALLSYLALGQASGVNRIDVAGNGSEVILIPDVASDGAALQPIAQHLSECHRTHTFTLSGFAGQPAFEDPVLGSWITSISRYIDTLDSHRATLVGHGLGGLLALTLALEHPDKVERLIILDSLPFPAAAESPGATLEQAKLQAQASRQKLLNQSDDAFQASEQQALIALTSQGNRIADLLAWSMASDRRGIANARYAMSVADLRNDIAHIRAPTLVLVPWDTAQREDTATTLDMYRKQYAKLPGVQVKLIKGSRHFLAFDQPIATNWAIDEFSGKCPSDTVTGP